MIDHRSKIMSIVDPVHQVLTGRIIFGLISTMFSLHSRASHRLINGVEESQHSLPPLLLDHGHKLGVDGRVTGLLQLAHQGPGLVPHEQRTFLINLLECYCCAYHSSHFSKGRFNFDHKVILLLDSSRI